MPSVPSEPIPFEVSKQSLVEDISVVVHLKTSRWYDFRLKFGLWLIRIGCHVAGLGYRDESEEASDA